MKKKYRVFISSTYEDLIKEREEVVKVLLEMHCFPIGMEFFHASNETSWNIIKKAIDECDYFLSIVAGRYGSTNSDGISYTELEYKYALKIKKPILGFIHADPDSLPKKYSEMNAANLQKLEKFRSLVLKKQCKQWINTHELGSVISRSLGAYIMQYPRAGWVKGDGHKNSLPTSFSTKSMLIANNSERLKLSKQGRAIAAELLRSGYFGHHCATHFASYSASHFVSHCAT